MNRMASIPMVALRGMTIVPEMVVNFDVSRQCSIEAIQEAMANDQKIFLLTQKDVNVENPTKDDLYRMGTVATIKQVAKLPKQILRVLITGEEKAILNAIEFSEPYMRANITIVEDADPSVFYENKREAMVRGLQELYAEYAIRNPKISKDVVKHIQNTEDIYSLVNKVAANLPIHYTELQQILEEMNFQTKYERISYRLVSETKIMDIKEEIQNKVKERLDRHQREYVLREELKLIREELGDDNALSVAEEFEQKAAELDATEEVKTKIQKEIKRFKNSMQSPAESSVLRGYIETMLEMPWEKRVEDFTDISYAREILEAEHYGLDEVKERVLEYLAVRAMTKQGSSPILCLVGPPGTGKTSIAKSLAKALKKPYVRISLGGVHDEAEIRGHRKTYVGAMPGRIANGIKTAGVKNPFLLLDEIDKVSTDHKGDTFSALLEVLDSEQNSRFRDHYLEVPLDLSEVTFVMTANSLQTIPGPLLDRMEIIEISGYTENEKVHIATKHLIPKQIEKHGIQKNQLSISKKVVWKLARNYTKEAGVRQLEREIGSICRKAAREIYEGHKKKIQVTERNLEKYVGKEKYAYHMANEQDEVGIVRGLAWTSVGGDTLQIEVNVMPGKGEILLTGQLGDVMKESAQTGISYIRSISDAHGVPAKFFAEHDIHIHIPEGAVPKDGPSAGITMATAMFSAITNQKVRADIAMTGEITLRGRVLPVGGLKEKLLAAKHAGMKTVLVPLRNKKDVEELSEEITEDLEIIPVEHMNEVLQQAIRQAEEIL